MTLSNSATFVNENVNGNIQEYFPVCLRFNLGVGEFLEDGAEILQNFISAPLPRGTKRLDGDLLLLRTTEPVPLGAIPWCGAEVVEPPADLTADNIADAPPAPQALIDAIFQRGAFADTRVRGERPFSFPPAGAFLREPTRTPGIRPALARAGFKPVPVRTGQKAPFGPDWAAEARAADPKILKFPARADARSTGILCDGLQVIDIDIDDEDAVDHVDAIARGLLGTGPVRFRAGSPRKLIVFRAAEGEPRKRILKGTRGAIEILGHGQQFVADGIHPDGSAYEWDAPIWDCGSDEYCRPLWWHRDNLVAVTEAQIDEFLSCAEPIIGAEVEKPKPTPGPAPRASQPVRDAGTRERAFAETALERNADELATCTEGGRNNALNAISYRLGRLIGAGWLSQSEVEATLDDAAGACGLVKDDGIRSVRKTMRSGIEAGIADPHPPLETDDDENIVPAGHSFVRQQVDPETGEVLEEADADAAALDRLGAIFDQADPPPPARWLVKGIIERCCVLMLAGQSGAGKSFLAVDLAVAAASGGRWLDRQVKERVGVAYIAGEGSGGLRRRILAARMARGIAAPLAIAVLSRAGDLCQPRAQSELIAGLAAADRQFRATHGVPLGIVIFDTVAASFLMKDENDAAEASKVSAFLAHVARQFDAVSLAVHHHGKDDTVGPRGSSAWRANVDYLLAAKVEKDGPIIVQRQLELTKARDGEEQPLRAFALRFVPDGRVDDDGDDMGSCAVEVTDQAIIRHDAAAGEKREKALSGANKNFMDALHEALITSGEVRHIHGEVTAPEVKMVPANRVREEFMKRHISGIDDKKMSDDARRKAWSRALPAMAAGGHFVAGSWGGVEWIWLPQS